MNIYKKIHGVSPLSVRGDFIQKKAVHGDTNFFGQTCRGFFYMGGIMIRSMPSGE